MVGCWVVSRGRNLMIWTFQRLGSGGGILWLVPHDLVPRTMSLMRDAGGTTLCFDMGGLEAEDLGQLKIFIFR